MLLNQNGQLDRVAKLGVETSGRLQNDCEFGKFRNTENHTPTKLGMRHCTVRFPITTSPKWLLDCRMMLCTELWSD
jgi:hypothetical protein